MTFPSDWN